MILYHGSNVVIKNPISTKGRSDVDFGSGFYLTADKNMARKWASNKNQSIVNVYEVNTIEPMLVKSHLTTAIMMLLLGQQQMTNFLQRLIYILTVSFQKNKRYMLLIV